MLRFGTSVHDDQVDVMSLFGRMLGEMSSPAPRTPTKPRGQTMDDIDKRQRLERLGIRNNEAYYA